MTETRLNLEDWLDDLCVRFIINLPREELESVERICFQVEEAQWFYEDFIRPLDPALPSLSLKAFAMRIFQHCPLMSQWSEYHHTTAFSEFLAYKTRVPVRGAIMLNETMDKVVLVKGWKKNASWSFPRGKINKEEKDLDCAVREVFEETGYDLEAAGLVKDDKHMKHIEITMREQHMKLYVFRGVPMDTQFAPQTRKEISKIEWVNLSDLPTVKKNKQAQHDAVNANKFYMVAPFLHPLKKWIAQQRKLEAKNNVLALSLNYTEGETSMDEGFVSANNGFTPRNAHIQPAVLSDLPEATSSEDVSSHLKRLLNIGGLVPNIPSAAPAALADPSKSNALLSLLRSGSNEVASQSASGHLSNLLGTIPQSNAPTHPGPDYRQSLGIPNQPLPTGSHIPPQGAPHIPPTPIRNVGDFPHSLNNAVPYSAKLRQPENQNVTTYGHPLPPGNHPSHLHHNRVIAAPSNPGQQHTVAPYQRTGDPEFAQQMNTAQFQGPTVPPASKLPPPKLTSHSLALLNVFKSQSPTPKPAVLSQPNTDQSALHPQDQLLALLKNSANKPSGKPAAELAAQPIQSAPIHILQRPAVSTKAAANVKVDRAEEEVLTSATVSGPLKTPEFGRKRNPHKEANGASIKANKKPTAPASPITILPRPSVGRRHSPVSSEQTSHPSSRSLVEQGNISDTPKNFQPQILRRSQKIDLESVLPTRTVPVHELSHTENLYATGSKVKSSQDKILHPDRRPSQTAAQKEALLNLFGKSPSDRPSHLVTPVDRPVSRNHLDVTSSPSLSGPETNIPSNISRLGSPSGSATSNPAAHRVTSPDNKAFLLGFLQNVAQGKK
ncbi:Dcp2, box A domain-containing protein [Talaromyces proteolyticus]|uniref:Dcp2, box A domain-containing protein n=1 Tax=Talaromyces proteolyticus TaxID=1131652 RepID=A0AAD4KP82_9EURO|nr:Dcp2, box A domain-containing protein [Talaromyces proteolyticus]KAH8696166.1 Dcp2, box A domain-containing protein [Talaromyces proteolyticus]